MIQEIKKLIKRIKDKEAKLGVIGLGYVGLPLVIRFCQENFKVLGFDIGGRVCLNNLKQVLSDKLLRFMPLPLSAVV